MKDRKNGVAFIIRQDVTKVILGCNAVNDQIVSIRLCKQYFNMMAIQVNTPITDEKEIDNILL